MIKTVLASLWYIVCNDLWLVVSWVWCQPGGGHESRRPGFQPGVTWQSSRSSFSTWCPQDWTKWPVPTYCCKKPALPSSTTHRTSAMTSFTTRPTKQPWTNCRRPAHCPPGLIFLRVRPKFTLGNSHDMYRKFTWINFCYLVALLFRGEFRIIFTNKHGLKKSQNCKLPRGICTWKMRSFYGL